MNNQEGYRGIVHGSSIELSPPFNLPDGMEVEVVIKQVKVTNEQRKQGLSPLFGSCQCDAEDLDKFLEENREQRRKNRSGRDA